MSFEETIDEAFDRLEQARAENEETVDTAVVATSQLWVTERHFFESLNARLIGADIVIAHNPDGGETAQALIHFPPAKTSTLANRERVRKAAVDAGWEIVHIFSFPTNRHSVVMVTVK